MIQINNHSKQIRAIEIISKEGFGMADMAASFNRAFFNKFDIILKAPHEEN